MTGDSASLSDTAAPRRFGGPGPAAVLESVQAVAASVQGPGIRPVTSSEPYVVTREGPSL